MLFLIDCFLFVLVIAIYVLLLNDVYKQWVNAWLHEEAARELRRRYELLFEKLQKGFRTGGNSHQRRLARRRLERAYKLTNA
jgi:hypothetical protein